MTDAEWPAYFTGWKARMGWSVNKIAHVLERSRQSVSTWVIGGVPNDPGATALVCETLEAYFTIPEYREFVDEPDPAMKELPWHAIVRRWVRRANEFKDRGRGRPRKVA